MTNLFSLFCVFLFSSVSSLVGVVFGPTCLRPIHETAETMMSGDDRCVIKAMIDLSPHVFPHDEDSDNEDTGYERASVVQQEKYFVPNTPSRFSRQRNFGSSDEEGEEDSKPLRLTSSAVSNQLDQDQRQLHHKNKSPWGGQGESNQKFSKSFCDNNCCKQLFIQTTIGLCTDCDY